MNLRYNIFPFSYKRLLTREVKVGDVGIGGKNPIRIQSMTTSDTQYTKSTVQQIIDLTDVGCEIVRLTVPSMADAENLINIRNELKRLNCKTPLVADIHFTPSVAMKVVEYVEKVRINPGNFADKKKFAVKEYTDSEYKEELYRIADTFIPLVRRCKELGVSMRIGTNHGSLSDRIMNRYGDTPAGMCESALEFIRIAESENFKNIIVSMKSSNPIVMVQAYRLLASKFLEYDINYPLHLGVTEAGNGIDGRIKSSIGIGSLLEDGIGDTIRVSLTEDAVSEIPVAKRLVKKYNDLFKKQMEREKSIRVPPAITVSDNTSYSEFRNPFQYERFYSASVPIGDLRIGEKYPIRVETAFDIHTVTPESLENTILTQTKINENVKHEILSFLLQNESDLKKLLTLKKTTKLKLPFSANLGAFDSRILEHSHSLLQFEKIVFNPFYYNFRSQNFILFLKSFQDRDKTCEFKIPAEDLSVVPDLIKVLQTNKITNIIFSLETNEILMDYRKLAFLLQNSEFPILLFGKFENIEETLYGSSVGVGGLFVDGIGDVIRLVSENSNPNEVLNLSFDILQATRLRTSKTEFISCPSCGRTLFDLQETTARIKKRTGHLVGVKIAIMGCIVNGPGEMADADFGYVGAGPGKVHLYFGKTIVSKSIPSELADEKLIELIKEKGMWKEP
ncbi:MAG: (E)-4-hydroxy-3-methylbut-2-enyl-diphosphate synthase [Leptospiraceae bacterium]|nr:(E)-4-hydroxy-3-methylbut-2-enyl-diphosphate synthase [Leptospiraceae bacterium]